uniref:CRIM domain-containing protein n=1 Tax=Steinernema glaseri TaxID=37863 RepID=A0A1I8AEB5_9BILA
MAFFDRDCLLDSTRHILRTEDDTSICSAVISRPTKQCRAGGLPLNFHKDIEEEDSDGSVESQGYLLDFSDGIQVLSTEEAVEERLRERSKTYENESAPQQSSTENGIVVPEENCNEEPEDEQEELIHPRQLPQQSAAEILLNKLGQTSDENRILQSFAHFEATEGTADGRQFLILFPFAHSENGRGIKLKISVVGSATVKDFIGLCCLVYSRSGNPHKCSDPSNYELYSAEENFDIDTFLPPLDDNRTMLECGFPTLALLEKQNASAGETYTITIHLVNKPKFTIDAPSLDLPLQWLLDNALMKRNNLQGCPNVGVEREYVIEPLAGYKEPLKLSNSIASVKTLDFVLLRKNSARGALNTSRSTSDPNSSAPELGSSPSKSPKSRTPEHKRQVSTLWEDAVPFEAPDDLVIRQYTVDRIHRNALKPKTHSLLVFRESTLDIIPLSTERRLNIVLPHSSATPLSIDWDYVGGVEIADRTSSKRAMKVIWLPVPESLHQYFTSCTSDFPSPISLQFPAIDLEANDTMLRHFLDTVNWKTLLLEISVDDVIKIANEINEIIEPRDSKIRRLYHYPGGSRRPGAVSETFLASLSPSLSSSTPTTPVPKTRKKLSIVPVLTRMLSKHEQSST